MESDSRESPPGTLSSISEEVVCCDLRDRAGQPMYPRTELGDPARWPLSLTLDQAPQRREPPYLSRNTTQPPSVRGKQSQHHFELSVVPDLLIENFKTRRFVEIFSPLQLRA